MICLDIVRKKLSQIQTNIFTIYLITNYFLIIYTIVTILSAKPIFVIFKPVVPPERLINGRKISLKIIYL